MDPYVVVLGRLRTLPHWFGYWLFTIFGILGFISIEVVNPFLVSVLADLGGANESLTTIFKVSAVYLVVYTLMFTTSMHLFIGYLAVPDKFERQWFGWLADRLWGRIILKLIKENGHQQYTGIRLVGYEVAYHLVMVTVGALPLTPKFGSFRLALYPRTPGLVCLMLGSVIKAYWATYSVGLLFRSLLT